LPNEERLHGAGIYYGAGASEAIFCANEHVYIVGGGKSAGQAALHFCRYTPKVTIVAREGSLKQTMSEYLIDRVRSEPKIEVLSNTVVTALHGERVLRAITLRNIRTGAEWVAETSRLFLCLGGVPHTQWAEEVGIVRDA
jgi:thioredoxin reductase (NADPH)